MGRNIEWIFPEGFSECKCVNNISKMATQWIMHRPHRLGREGRGWKLQNIQCRWSPAQPSYRTEISTAPNIEGIQGVAEHLVNLTGLTRNQKLFQTKLNLPVFFSYRQSHRNIISFLFHHTKIAYIFLFKKTKNIHKTQKNLWFIDLYKLPDDL